MRDNKKTVYQKILQSVVVDGDTLHVQFRAAPQYMGACTLRLLGLDTHELKSTNRSIAKKALAAKSLLKKLMAGFIRPRAVFCIKKDRNGFWKPEKDGRGRILAHLYVWRWVDVSTIMKGEGLEKKGSKWNEMVSPT